MIEILPALPVEEKPIDPRDRKIDLVALKNYEAHVGFPEGLDLWTRLKIAMAWAGQRDHEFDAQRGDYYR